MMEDGKVRSDAFIVVDILDKRYRFFLEVHISNNKHNLDKYSKLYETREVQGYISSNKYPRVLLITDRSYKNLDCIQNVDVVRVDTNLDGLIKAFL